MRCPLKGILTMPISWKLQFAKRIEKYEWKFATYILSINLIYSVWIPKDKCLGLIGFVLVHATTASVGNTIFVDHHQLNFASWVSRIGSFDHQASAEVWFPANLHVDDLHVVTTLWLTKVAEEAVLLVVGGVGHLHGHLIACNWLEGSCYIMKTWNSLPYIAEVLPAQWGLHDSSSGVIAWWSSHGRCLNNQFGIAVKYMELPSWDSYTGIVFELLGKVTMSLNKSLVNWLLATDSAGSSVGLVVSIFSVSVGVLVGLGSYPNNKLSTSSNNCWVRFDGFWLVEDFELL